MRPRRLNTVLFCGNSTQLASSAASCVLLVISFDSNVAAGSPRRDFTGNFVLLNFAVLACVSSALPDNVFPMVSFLLVGIINGGRESCITGSPSRDFIDDFMLTAAAAAAAAVAAGLVVVVRVTVSPTSFLLVGTSNAGCCEIESPRRDCTDGAAADEDSTAASRVAGPASYSSQSSLHSQPINLINIHTLLKKLALIIPSAKTLFCGFTPV